jgi:hypothetical protein
MSFAVVVLVFGKCLSSSVFSFSIYLLYSG